MFVTGYEGGFYLPPAPGQHEHRISLAEGALQSYIEAESKSSVTAEIANSYCCVMCVKPWTMLPSSLRMAWLLGCLEKNPSKLTQISLCIVGLYKRGKMCAGDPETTKNEIMHFISFSLPEISKLRKYRVEGLLYNSQS